MIRAVVIDDEPAARDMLHALISQYCPDIEIVGQAGEVEESVSLIRQTMPELLFLDIQLRNGNAFDVLRSIDHDQHKVIFTTAFEEYAVTAFRFSAVDYLLKPIAPEDLKTAVAKATESLETGAAGKRMEVLYQNLDPSLKEGRKIVLRAESSLRIIGLEEIIRCQADKEGTLFCLVNGETVRTSRPLKEFGELLGRYRFARVSESFLVNADHIRCYEKSHGGMIILSDETRIPVTFRKKEDFLRLIGQLSSK